MNPWVLLHIPTAGKEQSFMTAVNDSYHEIMAKDDVERENEASDSTMSLKGWQVSCSVCLEPVEDACTSERATAKLSCGHDFHLGE